MERVAAPLLQAIGRFEQTGFLPFQSQFNERDALHGMDVRLSDGTDGIAQGVNALGALRLQTAQGQKEINSSEVSVRPLP